MSDEMRYPGSQPFADTALHRLLFKGREQEKKALFHLILSEDLVVLYAKSGMGKTSLLNAGVFAPLRERDFLPVTARMSDPSGIGLIPSIIGQVLEKAREQLVEVVNGTPQNHLWPFFQALELWREDTLLTPVLILDQFEELFTLVDPAAREAFIDQLASLAQKRPPEALRGPERVAPLKIVISIREDYLGELELMARQIPRVLNQRFRLTPLTREQAGQAIGEPAGLDLPGQELQSRKFTFAPDALETLLDFLTTRLGRLARQGNEIEPFQLAIICRHLEELAIQRQEHGEEKVTITPADLGGREGLERIVQDFYLNQIQRLGEKNRSAARQLCERGLISRGKRISLEEEQIDQLFGVGQEVLRELVNLRLLRAEPRVGSVYYELSHDTLVTPILKARKESDPIDLFQEAEQARQTGNYPATLAGYEKVIQLDPGYTLAYRNWADLLMQLGRVDEAEKVYGRAIEQGIVNSTVYHQHGRLLAQRGLLPEAIRDYERAIEQDDRLASVYFDLGEACLQSVAEVRQGADSLSQSDESSSLLKQAGEAYAHALDLNPKNPLAYRQLALVRIREKRPEEALEIFQGAVRVDESYAFIFEDLAIDLSQRGKDDLAAEICLRALAVPSVHDQYYYRVGFALHNLGRLEPAVEAYRKSIALNPQLPDALFGWALSLTELERYQESIDKLRECLEQVPKSDQVRIQWGLNLALLERPGEAIEQFQDAAQLNPDNHEAFYQWGRSLMAMGRDAEAVAPLEKCLAIQPQIREAWFSLGSVYGTIGRHEDAVEAYRKLVEVAPDYLDAWFNLGVSLANLGRHDEAIETYLKITSLDPSYRDAWFNLGVSLVSLGRYEEALPKYRKVLDLDPASVDAWFNQGVCQGAMDQQEEAADSYRHVVEASPQDDVAFNNWGLCLYNLERYEEAIEKFSKSAELNPKSLSPYWGMCLDNLKRPEEAIEMYRRCVELNPDDSLAYSFWGWTLRNLGRHDEAIEKYLAAHRLEPTDLFTIGEVGWTYLLLKDYGSAIEFNRKALAIDPKTLWIQCNLGLALLLAGQIDEARKEYEKAIELTVEPKDIPEFERNAVEDVRKELERNPSLPGGKDILDLLEKALREMKDQISERARKSAPTPRDVRS